MAFGFLLGVIATALAFFGIGAYRVYHEDSTIARDGGDSIENVSEDVVVTKNGDQIQ